MLKYKLLMLLILLIIFIPFLQKDVVAVVQGTYIESRLVPCGGTRNPCEFKDLFVLLHNIVEFLLLKLGPAVTTFMVAYGGFRVIISSQSPYGLRRGKEIIKWAILGYGLMLTAWIIINTILLYLGLAEWTNFKDWWNPKF